MLVRFIASSLLSCVMGSAAIPIYKYVCMYVGWLSH